MKKHLFLIILASIFLAPGLAKADLVVTQTQFFLGFESPLLILLAVILIEWLIFLIIADKFCKLGVLCLKAFVIVFLANFISYILGIFIPLSNAKNHLGQILPLFILGYPITSFIEWGIISKMLKVFRYDSKNSAKISFIVNLASYIFLVILVVLFYNEPDPFLNPQNRF